MVRFLPALLATCFTIVVVVTPMKPDDLAFETLDL
jgi:hypothetical protein